MKLTLIFLSLAISVSAAHKNKNPWNWWMPDHVHRDNSRFVGHFYENNRGVFKGISGMSMNQTTVYIVAQLGPGLVTDMTIFAVCGEKPVKFSEKEIITGFGCRDEANYACYKTCQMEKLGYIEKANGSDAKVNMDKIQTHFKALLPKGDKVVDDLEECFRGRTFKKDKRCMSMKNAMQCVWNSYYKTCQPNSEFAKNKRLVGDDFFAEEKEDNDDKDDKDKDKNKDNKDDD